MTTQEQREKFGRFLAEEEGHGETSYFLADEPMPSFRLVETRDTVAQFDVAMFEFRRHRVEEFEGLTIHVWTASQRRKGETRVDLFVADCGEARLAWTI